MVGFTCNSLHQLKVFKVDVKDTSSRYMWKKQNKKNVNRCL